MHSDGVKQVIITLHQNKEKEYHLNTVGQVRDPRGMKNEEIPSLVPKTRKVTSTLT